MKPISLDEANEHLKTALQAGDEEEIKKWDWIIRSTVEWRAKKKQEARAFKSLSLNQ